MTKKELGTFKRWRMSVKGEGTKELAYKGSSNLALTSADSTGGLAVSPAPRPQSLSPLKCS